MHLELYPGRFLLCKKMRPVARLALLGFVSQEESEQEYFGSFGVIADHTARTCGKILFTHDDPEDNRQGSITNQCPPNQVMPLLEE